MYDALANVADPHPQTLQDYLLHQIGEMEVTPEMFAMAEKIISTLDPRDGGYFRSSLRDLLPADAGPEQIQLADLLTGVVSYANRLQQEGPHQSPAKQALVERVRARSHYSLTRSTLLAERKLNVFHWRPQDTTAQ